MIFFRAFKYMEYILLSKHRNGHGIHSPFIYDLVSRVFRNKTDRNIVMSIETIRKKMRTDTRTLNINDLGAGSVKMKKNTRKVSEIAHYSPVTARYGALLSVMAAEFGQYGITELGTSLGISTMYMAMSCTGTVVATIEGCNETANVARENFAAAGVKNIVVHTGSFDELLPVMINEDSKPGLVFIDGDHRKEPVLRYFSKIAGNADNNTVIIIDDIYYSSGMEEAWKEIKKCSSISVTVDVFRMGIVFFRKGITRTDYVVRY